MNLALPALVILLLVLPGVLFTYTYRRGLFGRSPVSLSSIQDEIGRGIFWAILIQAFGALVVYGLPGIDPDYQALLALLAGYPDKDVVRSDLAGVHAYVGGVVTYLLAVNVGAVLSGYGLHQVVRKSRLDLRYDFLRFSNEWFYLFSGEARVFEVEQKKRTLPTIRGFLSQKVDFTFISVVVQHHDGDVLIWGVLADYFFADGRLDKIVLTKARRRTLKDDNADEGVSPEYSPRFYRIRGDYFVIRYSDVLNLNIEYKLLTEDERLAREERAHFNEPSILTDSELAGRKPLTEPLHGDPSVPDEPPAERPPDSSPPPPQPPPSVPPALWR